MTTWKGGGDYGRYSREITDESGRRVICHVHTRQSDDYGDEPWLEGEANFHLILQAPQMLEALRTIAKGAIVSPDQPPEKIAEQVLRVLQIRAEGYTGYQTIAGIQQQRAERMLEALEAIRDKVERMSRFDHTPAAWEMVLSTARAAIAAAKGKVNEKA